MTSSRYFEGAGERPHRIHITRGGGRGREIRDLRNDTEQAFRRVDQEFIGSDGDGRWKDVQGRFDEGSGVAALTIEAYRDTPLKFPHLLHNQNDEMHFTFQMQHDWNVATSVRPHVHLIPLSDPVSDQVVVFDGYYVWSQFGVVLPAWLVGPASRRHSPFRTEISTSQ